VVTTVRTFAERDPDRIALVFGNGESKQSYGELEARSRRAAHALRGAGLEPGDTLAVVLGNDEAFFELFWACHRSGLYFTPVSWHLQADEIAYVLEDSDAKGVFAHARFADSVAEASSNIAALQLRVSVGGEIEGFRAFEEVIADAPQDSPLEDELEGALMLYSSGTTGRPKGVRRPLKRVEAGDPGANITVIGLTAIFGMKEGDVYLCPAPLYHSAPITFTPAQHRIGATAVIMRHFDAEEALATIQDQRVTTSQWVPTHFRRLLRLPQEVRERYDCSSLRVAVHAAAPCPVPLKEQMIDWWGDAITEYYAGTEGGGTLIRAGEWLEHKGSVGRHWTKGTIHILDEEGEEAAQGQDGAVYFEAAADPAARFSYHKDEAKTAESYRGDLYTIGDIGHLDEEGFLYLTDRQANMIISGGVNIYPQETENHLLMHPKVDDVAVIGVPNDEMGEEVKAVVVPTDGAEAGPALETELIDYCRAGIAHFKAPRSIDFTDELPRTETGKMQKRKLRDRYWGGKARLV
jgi:acyl-coenzyme A synthetase/AMP-(fatty) acid ligase